VGKYRTDLCRELCSQSIVSKVSRRQLSPGVPGKPPKPGYADECLRQEDESDGATSEQVSPGTRSQRKVCISGKVRNSALRAYQ